MASLNLSPVRANIGTRDFATDVSLTAGISSQMDGIHESRVVSESDRIDSDVHTTIHDQSDCCRHLSFNSRHSAKLTQSVLYDIYLILQLPICNYPICIDSGFIPQTTIGPWCTMMGSLSQPFLFHKGSVMLHNSRFAKDFSLPSGYQPCSTSITIYDY